MNVLRKIKLMTATAVLVASALGLTAQTASAATNNWRSGSISSWHGCSVSVWLVQDTSQPHWPNWAAGNINCSQKWAKTVATSSLQEVNTVTGAPYKQLSTTTFNDSYGFGTKWLYSPGIWACPGWKVQGVFSVTITDYNGNSYSTYVTTGSPQLPPSMQSC